LREAAAEQQAPKYHACPQRANRPAQRRQRNLDYVEREGDFPSSRLDGSKVSNGQIVAGGF